MKKYATASFVFSVVLFSHLNLEVNAAVKKVQHMKPSMPQSSGKNVPPQGYEKSTWETRCEAALNAASAKGFPPKMSTFDLEEEGGPSEMDVTFQVGKRVEKVWGLTCHNNPMTLIVLEDTTCAKKDDVLIGQEVNLDLRTP